MQSLLWTLWCILADGYRCSPSCFSAIVVSPGEEIKWRLCVSFKFKVSALNILFLALSPIKIANFESHYIKLQADSNYLLSDEFEVSF